MYRLALASASSHFEARLDDLCSLAAVNVYTLMRLEQGIPQIVEEHLSQAVR